MGLRKFSVGLLSVAVALLAIEIAVVHHQAPYLSQQCVAFRSHCPISKAYGRIRDGSNGAAVHLHPLRQIMANWVRRGYAEGAQLSVFVANEERVNLFVRDDAKKPKFNQNSITSIFSSSKNFASLLIAIAVQNRWIESYDDAVSRYWPDFPSTRFVVPFEEYMAFIDQHCSDAADLANCTKPQLRSWCEARNVGSFRKHYVPKLKDVLRHEAGYAISFNQEEIRMNATSHSDIARMIESEPFLLHFEESPRIYHALTRGYVLNEIFRRAEPRGRSMSDYFNDEIAGKISGPDGDSDFFLRFDGLRGEKAAIDRMYHITQQPAYWSLYHVVLPLYFGRDRPFSTLFARELCPSEAMDEALCPRESLEGTAHFMATAGKFPSGNIVDWDIGAGPAVLSKAFEGKLAMATMSASGIGSAHSVARAAAHILFSGEVLEKASVEHMVSERVLNRDMMLGFDTMFGRGGFHCFDIQGLLWHGWGGWGGSLFVFNIEHEAVIAFLPTAFNSVQYTGFAMPRAMAILNLVTQQLLSDSK